MLSKLVESIVSQAVERTSDLLIHEAKSLASVKDDVERLRTELRRMQCFLKDADRKQEQDERVRNWVAEVKDVALDVEDAIETFIEKVSSSYVKVFHLRRLRSIINSIYVKIEDIFKSTQTYRIEFSKQEGTRSTTTTTNASAAADHARRRNLRRSYEDPDDDVVTLDDSLTALKDQLMRVEDRLCVVSVVGMGGLGKTTLAKLVYNSSDVKGHFDCCAWVFISQQFTVRDVLFEILVQIGFDDIAKKNLEELKKDKELLEKMQKRETIKAFEEHKLIELIKNELKGKRFLVVLDDIWRSDAWNSIRGAFPKGKGGSKVLFTTRMKEVASSADPWSVPIEPPFLTFEKGWELLRRKAFPSDVFGNQVCPQEFEKLGKEMLKKCGGLPLAIVVLGGLLSTKTSLDGWKKVQRDVNFQLNKLKSHESFGVEDILALSYYDLPYYLKPCFLYLGYFPEDSEIAKKKLTRLWIAEGFIPTPAREESEELVEDIAEQFLGELVDRCMVQVDKTDHTGIGVKTCRMHDLMRDFCVSKAREDNFFKTIQRHEMNTATTSNSAQHLATTHSRRIAIHLGCDLSRYRVHPHIRSLLFFDVTTVFVLPLTNKNFRLLRVVEFGFTRFRGGSEVPSEIGNMIHLRYLGLRGAGISKLPESVGNLRNLHTLDLRNNTGLKLPRTISRLVRLRHLLLPFICKFVPSFLSWSWSHFSLLTLANIETLKYVNSGDLIKYNEGHKLTNVRTLGIKFKSKEEVGPALDSSIVELGGLRTLRMYLLSDEFPSLKSLSRCHNLSKLLIEGKVQEHIHSCHHILQFLPDSLTKLVLIRSVFSQDPLEALEKLPNLRFLRLYNSYVGSRLVCSAHGFPKLETLELVALFQVEEWKVKKGAMPSLKNLHIETMPKLSMIPKELKFVTISGDRKINFMSQSFVDRAHSP